MKKHFLQMTNGEKKYLVNRFNSIPMSKWKLNGYSKKRVKERKVDMAVYRTLWTHGFDLVEFHQHDSSKENRILIRSIMTDKEDNQVCAVFNFTTYEVTTVYLNWKKNKHDNLVWSEYDSSIDVKGLMKGGK
jgi:hypothetical protein